MAKHKHSLIRKKNSRTRNPITIIICEGRQTEPIYLRALVAHIRIHSASVRIDHGDDKTNPQQLVQKAKEKMKSYGYTEETDKAFVVCDDEHVGLERAKNEAKNNNIAMIISKPCFDYWVLLHLEETTKLFDNCKSLTKYLKEKYNYKKEDGTYEKGKFSSLIQSELANAIKRADKINLNPDISLNTDMPNLVRALKKMNPAQSI